MKALALLLLLGCAPSPVDERDPPPCSAPEHVEATLPSECWEADGCDVSEPADVACGRAYVCPLADGDHVGCVIARDCACMEAWAAACDDVEIPAHCELQQ